MINMLSVVCCFLVYMLTHVQGFCLLQGVTVACRGAVTPSQFYPGKTLVLAALRRRTCFTWPPVMSEMPHLENVYILHGVHLCHCLGTTAVPCQVTLHGCTDDPINGTAGCPTPTSNPPDPKANSAYWPKIIISILLVCLAVPFTALLGCKIYENWSAPAPTPPAQEVPPAHEESFDDVEFHPEIQHPRTPSPQEADDHDVKDE